MVIVDNLFGVYMDILVIDNEDGIYFVLYILFEEGIYMLSVKFGGDYIFGSLFKVGLYFYIIRV